MCSTAGAGYCSAILNKGALGSSQLVNAGFTGKFSPRDKDSVVQTLSLHYGLLSVIAEVDQLCEGLKTLEVLDAVRQHPELFRRLFLKNLCQVRSVV